MLAVYTSHRCTTISHSSVISQESEATHYAQVQDVIEEVGAHQGSKATLARLRSLKLPGSKHRIAHGMPDALPESIRRQSRCVLLEVTLGCVPPESSPNSFGCISRQPKQAV